jgi:addiction module RelE/StbE family toxin
MKIRFQKSFTEQFSRLSKPQKQLVKDALEFFGDDPMHDSLRNHPLKRDWSKYRSITADDDLRLHYRVIGEDIVLFVAVGSHDELYR